MLDEPTNDTITTPAGEDAPKPRRRRAASKPAGSAAEALTATAQAATGDAPDPAAQAAAETGAAVTAEGTAATGEAPAAPAKRVRKAPAKKAAAAGDAVPAPRKRASRAAAPPVEVAPEPELTEDELAAQAALAADAPAADAPAADGPSAAAPADDATADAPAADAPTAADSSTSAPAEDAPAPAKRTRARRPAVVTFQAPEPAPDAVEPAAAEAPDDAPAPRRRRRAGTTGAVSAAALVPELIEPVEVQTPAGGSDAPDADDDDEDGDRPRRRRRGRRGRGPRPAGENGEVEGDDDAPETADPASTTDDSETPADDDEAGGTRRRRRRRRSGAGGEEGEESTPAPAREPREPRAPRNRSQGGGGAGATSADEDGVRGITGSTRMAAKRVRRQEGRDSGRKRQPILSEAEFLARREAVDRTMVVRQKGDRTQIAVLEDGVLVEHYVTKASAQAYAGNVYLGRVQNVLPSMEAAFVDVGKSRNAVLYAGEVNYNASVGGRSRSIESVLKSGQEIVVQVSKDPIGHKGARLTGQVSLPGRYLVYVPEGTMTGISRKLPETERNRLKAILKTVVPDDAGVIIRTAAEGASEEEIAGDVRRLQAQWEVIQAKAAKGGAPALLHAEPDLVIRVVRDVFNEDFTRLVVQGDTEWDTIKEYVDFVAPDLAPRVSRHEGQRDVFAEHRIDEQLAKALDRKVWLPSGGSLVIDRTEAMVVVDVNTGKYVGKGGNLEETVTRNNLEAAEEIARQLRLRDLGGIIVVDFIDMVLESNRDLVVKRLVECLGRDRTKHQVAEVTSLGLVQMTRKRVGQGLLESFSEPCDHCQGRGVLVSGEPVDGRRSESGDGDEPRRDRAPRVRSVKPLPADAPRPGAGVSGSAPTDVPADDDAPAAPKRRRRGGRGSGSATVASGDELAEILAPAEAGAAEGGAANGGSADGSAANGGSADGSAANGGSADGGAADGGAEVGVDGGAAQAGAADGGAAEVGAAEIKAAAVEAAQVDAAEVVAEEAAEVDATEVGPDVDDAAAEDAAVADAPAEGAAAEDAAPGAPAAEPTSGVADAAAVEASEVAGESAPGADEVAAAPRRRRRATSRPAGPPAV